MGSWKKIFKLTIKRGTVIQYSRACKGIDNVYIQNVFSHRAQECVRMKIKHNLIEIEPLASTTTHSGQDQNI